MLSYKSCKGCRDQDKKYNNIYNIKEDDDTSDDNNGSECYYDGCVEYHSDGDMVGFI